jgi:hypothetical protein
MICNKCSDDKEETEFELSYKKPGARRKTCKDCRNTSRRDGRVGERRERINKQKREWGRSRKDKINKYSRDHNKRHPEVHRRHCKNYYEKLKKTNPEKINENSSRYRERHREELAERALETYYKDVEKGRERSRKYQREHPEKRQAWEVAHPEYIRAKRSKRWAKISEIH